MSYQAAIIQLSESGLTAQMTTNAVRLLARTEADGTALLAMEELLALFDVATRNAARKYLARLRAAGLLDYSLGRASARVWWLAWTSAGSVSASTGSASASASSANGRGSGRAGSRPAAERMGPATGTNGAGSGAVTTAGAAAMWTPWDR